MKQIKFGIILNYLSIFLTFAVGLVYTPFLVKNLGQVEYGMYSLAFAIAGYLSLLDLGIGNSIVRYISQNQIVGNKKRESQLAGFFFKFFLRIGVLTLIIGLLITWNLNFIVSSEFSAAQIHTLKWMLFILTINFALSFVLNTFTSIIQAYQRFIFLKLTNVIRIFATPFISVFILMYNANLILLTLVLAIVNLSVLMINFVYFKKKINVILSFEPMDLNLKKEILNYAVFIFIVAIADKIYWQTDQILLGMLKNPESVAIFAIAISFVMIFMSLSTAINTIFLPKVTQLVSKENHLEELNQLYIKVSKVQTLIIGITLTGFVLVGKEFINLWVGKEFEVAYYLVLILMAPFWIDLIQNMGITIMQAKGQYKFRAYTLIICAILNIIISVPIIKAYGLIGTAVVTAIFVLVGNVIILNFYFHLFIGLNMKKYWKAIFNLVSLITVIFIISMYIKNLFVITTWLTLFTMVLIYAAIYCLTFYILFKKRIMKL